MERREPPRNFLEVALRHKMEEEPKFTPGNPPGNERKKPEKDVARTPVRKKISRIEEKMKNLQETPGRKRKRGTGVQSTELSPLQKQSRVTEYFTRKSPKANSLRQKVENKQVQGAEGPLLGVLGESPLHGDHPPDEVSAGNRTSAETGCLEERGRATKRKDEEKRKHRFLESVATGPRGEKEGSARKGYKGVRKQERDSRPEKVQDIRKWFEAKGEALGQTQGKQGQERKGGSPVKEAS